MTAVLRIIVEPKELFHVLLKGKKKRVYLSFDSVFRII